MIIESEIIITIWVALLRPILVDPNGGLISEKSKHLSNQLFQIVYLFFLLLNKLVKLVGFLEFFPPPVKLLSENVVQTQETATTFLQYS